MKKRQRFAGENDHLAYKDAEILNFCDSHIFPAPVSYMGVMIRRQMRLST